MYTEEELMAILGEMNVKDEDKNAILAKLKAKEAKEEEKKEEPSEEEGETETKAEGDGGEPKPEDGDKGQGGAEQPMDGGEPTKEEAKQEPATPNYEALEKKIDSYEQRFKDLTSTIEGLAAANKRNEEIIASLGEKTKDKPAPFGKIDSSDAKDRKDPKSDQDKTLDFLGKLAGGR